MNRPAIAVISTSLALCPSAGPAQVTVIDNSNLGRKTPTAQNAEEIKKTAEKQTIAHARVSCANYRRGRGPTDTADENPAIVNLVKEKAQKYGVDEKLALSLVYQESRFNPCARSHVGAYGLTQLMPGTENDLGINSHNIEQNVDGGMRYLGRQINRYDGDTSKALAAYNAGPGNVNKYGGVPPFRETRGYVATIQGKWMPAFGGYSSTDPNAQLSSEWSSMAGQQTAAFTSLGGETAAGSDDTAMVKQFYEGKSQAHMQNGLSVLDQWDMNTDVRNANASLAARFIQSANAFAQGLNVANTVTALMQSESAETMDYDPSWDVIKDPKRGPRRKKRHQISDETSDACPKGETLNDAGDGCVMKRTAGGGPRLASTDEMTETTRHSGVRTLMLEPQ
jgi:hypothetical protein